MKKGTRNNVKLGIFVFTALILFTGAIYFVGKRQRLFSDVIRLGCVFKDVSGLRSGNNVKFAGIDVGTVEDITILNDSSVLVSMVLDKDVKKFIRKDSRAVVGSEGLMGNKIISIGPGTERSETIGENDIILSIPAITFDDILVRLKTTSENAAVITDDLAAITGNIRGGKGTIGKLFMDTAFATNIDQTLGNIKRGTKGFEQNMSAAKKSFWLRGAFRKKKDREPKK